MGRERPLPRWGGSSIPVSPKTHPYTQDTLHAPCGVRAGAPSGLSGRNLGPGSEPGSRGIALLALCTWAKSCSFWASLSSSTKWGNKCPIISIQRSQLVPHSQGPLREERA